VALYRYGDRAPTVAESAWVADSARIIGNVTVAEECYIGHGVILRGDYGDIIVGPGSAVEEHATVHIRPGGKCVLGKQVTVGHGAILHCNKIEDFAVIGMGSVISFDVEIGEWSIVAEGTVVPAGKKIPPGKIVTGVPGQVTGDVEPRHKTFWQYGKRLYIELAHQYPEKFERID